VKVIRPGPALKTPGSHPGRTGDLGNRTGTRWSVKDALLFLPRFALLMGRLVKDPEISRVDKALLVAGLAYLASPFDVIPDFIPLIGELDDLYVAGLVCLRLVNRAGAEKLRAYWDGPEDIVAVLEGVSALTAALLPRRARWLILRAVGRSDLDRRGGG
jgi:uncharacterized membrane protein YkvA (DUF1232 family)